MDTSKLVHLSPGMQKVLDDANQVCSAWENKPRDNVQIAAAIEKLKSSLRNFALGDTRQPHARDPRQKGPI